ncbi:MAG TPA: tRNA (guanine(10)-N(2))-dimethyltransferase [Thermoplasmatales archaeon]|nr:tRNA (guanine(10)-N(2))-dimethyltransferase [Thermoplasmatales archaeon]
MATLVFEGETKIFLEEFHDYSGPGRKHAGFYNPVLEIDRDLNVLFCRYIAKKGAKKFLDGLASSGIRGIRIAREVDGDIEMHINDCNPKSYEIIKKNVEINGVSAYVYNKHFCSVVQEKKYDYIDIDPYGSPIPFLSCIFKALKKLTYISITATDTATLCGAFDKACIRKYQAIPLKKHSVKEAGLRILIGYMARQAGSFDYSFKPLIGYSYGHFFRVYAKIEKGARKSNENIKNVGWVGWKNGWKLFEYDELDKSFIAGPLWIGKIYDKEVIDEISQIVDKKKLNKKEKLKKMLAHFKEEESLPPLYYETRYIAKEIKTAQPKIERLIKKLKNKGYKAGKTHFMSDAFKTDAPYDEIKRLFG